MTAGVRAAMLSKAAVGSNMLENWRAAAAYTSIIISAVTQLSWQWLASRKETENGESWPDLWRPHSAPRHIMVA